MRREARDGEDLADRREDVGQLDRRVDGRPRRTEIRPRSLRELHEERDLEDVPVEEDAVLVLAVLAEALAVVGEDDDEGPVVEPLLPEEGEEAADDGVRRPRSRRRRGCPDAATGTAPAARRARAARRDGGTRRGRVRRLPSQPSSRASVSGPGRWTRLCACAVVVGSRLSS